VSPKFTPSSKEDITVDQATRILTFIEKTAVALRQKIEKEKKIPPWLLARIQQVAIDLRLTAPFLSPPAKKKFEPSIKHGE
jgi:hypothetical protein